MGPTSMTETALRRINPPVLWLGNLGTIARHLRDQACSTQQSMVPMGKQGSLLYSTAFHENIVTYGEIQRENKNQLIQGMLCFEYDLNSDRAVRKNQLFYVSLTLVTDYQKSTKNKSCKMKFIKKKIQYKRLCMDLNMHQNIIITWFHFFQKFCALSFKNTLMLPTYSLVVSLSHAYTFRNDPFIKLYPII